MNKVKLPEDLVIFILGSSKSKGENKAKMLVVKSNRTGPVSYKNRINSRFRTNKLLDLSCRTLTEVS